MILPHLHDKRCREIQNIQVSRLHTCLKAIKPAQRTAAVVPAPAGIQEAGHQS